MKKDIETRSDIELLVKKFYQKVIDDEELSLFFGFVNWEEHIPIMCDFWETMLFQNNQHRGDFIARHVKIDEQQRTEKIHYDKWVNLFLVTVDEYFEGEKATLIKNYTQTLSIMMQSAIKQQRNSIWKKFGTK